MLLLLLLLTCGWWGPSTSLLCRGTPSVLFLFAARRRPCVLLLGSISWPLPSTLHVAVAVAMVVVVVATCDVPWRFDCKNLGSRGNSLNC